MIRAFTLVLLAALPLVVFANFHQGDFIQTSRKSQHTGARTHWHDLLGRHCPRFGKDSVVAVPLPKPHSYDAVGDYKVQLAFDHERLTTTWLPVLDIKPSPMTAAKGVKPGPGNEHVPIIEVELTGRGDELIRATAQSVRLPENFLKYFPEHPTLLQEYKDAQMWPKHLLIRYRWHSVEEVDADRGLLVLLYSGLIVVVALMAFVVSSHGDKLAEFMQDMVAEEAEGRAPGEKGD